MTFKILSMTFLFTCFLSQSSFASFDVSTSLELKVGSVSASAQLPVVLNNKNLLVRDTHCNLFLVQSHSLTFNNFKIPDCRALYLYKSLASFSFSNSSEEIITLSSYDWLRDLQNNVQKRYNFHLYQTSGNSLKKIGGHSLIRKGQISINNRTVGYSYLPSDIIPSSPSGKDFFVSLHGNDTNNDNKSSELIWMKLNRASNKLEIEKLIAYPTLSIQHVLNIRSENLKEYTSSVLAISQDGKLLWFRNKELQEETQLPTQGWLQSLARFGIRESRPFKVQGVHQSKSGYIVVVANAGVYWIDIKSRRLIAQRGAEALGELDPHNLVYGLGGGWSTRTMIMADNETVIIPIAGGFYLSRFDYRNKSVVLKRGTVTPARSIHSMSSPNAGPAMMDNKLYYTTRLGGVGFFEENYNNLEAGEELGQAPNVPDWIIPDPFGRGLITNDGSNGKIYWTRNK